MTSQASSTIPQAPLTRQAHIYLTNATKRDLIAARFPGQPDALASRELYGLIDDVLAMLRATERGAYVPATLPADDAPAHDWRCPGCGMDREELQRKAETGNLNLAEQACHRGVCGRREAWAKGAAR